MTESDDQKELRHEFRELVNMQPKELEEWLARSESKNVGQRQGDDESVGHKSGKQIVKILRTNKANLVDEDYQHMSKVRSYIKRHLAQRPQGDVSTTPWRYSLMNWGHDPLRN